jgi:hypothetical protein
MSIRETIKPYLVEWPMSDKLDPVNFEINRLVSQLDDVAIGYEAKWGAGFLEAKAYAHTPELAEKWQRQVDKLNDAINNADLGGLRALVDGCIRGYSQLEQNAYSLGLKPNETVVFNHTCGSTVYRVVRTVAEARLAMRPGDKNVKIISCEEMCNFFEKEAVRIFCKREDDRAAESKKPDHDFNWKTGDELPPEF